MAEEWRDKLFEKVGNVIVYVLGALIVALVIGYVNLWSTVSKIEKIDKEVESRPEERLVKSWLRERDSTIESLINYSQENRSLISQLTTRVNTYSDLKNRQNISTVDLWQPKGGKYPNIDVPVYPIHERREYILAKATYDF